MQPFKHENKFYILRKRIHEINELNKFEKLTTIYAKENEEDGMILHELVHFDQEDGEYKWDRLPTDIANKMDSMFSIQK